MRVLLLLLVLLLSSCSSQMPTDADVMDTQGQDTSEIFDCGC